MVNPGTALLLLTCSGRQGFADEDKRGPKVRMGIRLAKCSDRALQRGSPGFATPEARVERRHEIRRALIVDIPKREQNRLRPGIEKATHEAKQFITSRNYVQSRGTAAQSDKLGIEFQMIQIV